MNVDTGEFTALRDQADAVSALGRKVSALTGRVTVMGKHVNRLDDEMAKDLGLLIRVVGHLSGADGMRPAAKHAAPKADRHLRLIEGGRQ